MDEIKAIRDNLKEFSVNKLYLADWLRKIAL